MPLSVSDDKSTYATLKGLVELLEKDAAQAKRAMNNYGTRSQDYARAEGEMNAYNVTISLIQTLDVWRYGVIAEEEAKHKPHLHAWDTMRSEMEPYLLYSQWDLNAFLTVVGYTTMFEANLDGNWCFDKCTKPVEECRDRYIHARTAPKTG